MERLANGRYLLKENRIAVCEPGEEGKIVVFVNPDEETRKRIVNEYKIDEHTLHSALDPHEPSRLEFEPNHLALIFKSPRVYEPQHHLSFKVTTIGAFLFKDLLVIIMNEKLELFTKKLSNRANSLADVTLKLIYQSIYNFLDHLRIINMITDELEAKINISMENKYLISLFSLGKSLVYYQNSIDSNRVLLEKLKLNSAKIGFNLEEVELLDDISIENNQCYRQAEIYSNILASLMDARASIVSNNINVLVKKLNIITIAIMVPTFVVSAFSMNVGIPIQHYKFAFGIIMGLSIISVLAFFLVWKFKKW